VSIGVFAVDFERFIFFYISDILSSIFIVVVLAVIRRLKKIKVATICVALIVKQISAGCALV